MTLFGFEPKLTQGKCAVLGRCTIGSKKNKARTDGF